MDLFEANACHFERQDELIGANHETVETKELERPGFRDNPTDRCFMCKTELYETLTKLAEECDLVQDVRILGLMIGIELTQDGAPVVKSCMDRRLLVNCTRGTVIRLLPAMTLSDEQAQEGCDILTDVIKSL